MDHGSSWLKLKIKDGPVTILSSEGEGEVSRFNHVVLYIHSVLMMKIDWLLS